MFKNLKIGRHAKAIHSPKLSSKQLTNYFIENLKLVYLMLLRHSILQTNLETFFI